MADRYFIQAGSGMFEDTECWSLTKGGESGASVPGAGDVAIFDENSAQCQINSEVLCQLNVDDAPQLTLMVVGTEEFGQGILSLQSDLTIQALSVQGTGVFQSNDYAVNLGTVVGEAIADASFSCLDTPTVDFGSSIITIGNGVSNVDFILNEAVILTATDATIILNLSPSNEEGTGGDSDFYGGGKIFGTVTIYAVATGVLGIHGNNTFGQLLISGDGIINFEDTQTLSEGESFVATGVTPGGLILGLFEEALDWTLDIGSGAVTITNCNISHSIATGGANFNAINCVDGGGNTGWNFFFEGDEDPVYSDIGSRLIPFVFSVSDAFALEFGDYYIRFIHNREQIVKAYAAWVTATNYLVGELVTDTGSYYRCLVNHTSGTFATDLGTDYWEETEGATDLVYEIPSPYAVADIKTIKYCQSADVLYLFHPSYAPRKLSRIADDEWQLTTVNFRPPPTIESSFTPDATLTPSATTGENILFTASAAVFLTGDVTRMIVSGASRAVIKSFNSTTEIICDIIDDFINTDVIASGDWKMTGSPIGALLPSIGSPINASMSLAVDDADLSGLTKIAMTIPGEDNWELSASGTNEYYLKNTASFYTSGKPAAVYVNAGAYTCVEGTLGALLSDWQWGWGDNDALGYDTIYFCCGYGTASLDPDGLGAPNLMRSVSLEVSDVFRDSDVGKYVYIYGGLIKITTILSNSKVSGIILKELDPDLDNAGAIEPTSTWTLREDLWSAANGYPSCGVFYEDRLVLSGVTAYPENVRGSAVGDYENFSPGTGDDDSYDFSIAGRLINTIHWIEPREYLILGSTGAEWRLGPEDSGAAMTPLNVVAKQQTSFGCANLDPLTIRNCTLFVQRALRKIREFTNNPTSVNIEYVAPDLTMLAEHITEGKIAGMCYQQEPLSIVWIWMEDGTLASMTYLRDEDVIGWARHPISGTVESMCCIPADGYDEVYAIIKRTINGVVIRSIEVLEKLFIDDTDTFDDNKGLNAFFVDCGITYNDVPATSIPVAHLIGEEVAILADGQVKANQTVDGSGNITLTTAASVVHAGLPYNGKMTTMRPEIALQDGTAQGRMKRIINLVIRVLNSGTFKAGRDAVNVDEYGFATYDSSVYQVLFANSDLPTASPISLFTGDKKVPFDGDFNREGRLTIIQDKPLPLTVVAIAAELEIT